MDEQWSSGFIPRQYSSWPGNETAYAEQGLCDVLAIKTIIAITIHRYEKKMLVPGLPHFLLHSFRNGR